MAGQTNALKDVDSRMEGDDDAVEGVIQVAKSPSARLALPDQPSAGSVVLDNGAMKSQDLPNGHTAEPEGTAPQGTTVDSANQPEQEERPSKRAKTARGRKGDDGQASSKASSVSENRPPKRKYTRRTDNTATPAASTPPPSAVPPAGPAPPSTPTNIAPPPEFNNSPRTIFHPGPVPSLEIFTRAPSPGLTQALHSAMGIPSTSQSSLSSALTSLPSSSSNGGPPYMVPESHLVDMSATGPPTSTAGSMDVDMDRKATPITASGPVTPHKGRPVRLSAHVSPSRYNEAALASSSQLQGYGSLSGSPYGIKRNKKVGGMKGKGKAGENGEMEQTITNNDYCSACRGGGSFLCCDGCPRSFHFLCLEPPMDPSKLPEEEEWFCKECLMDRKIKTNRSTSSANRHFDPLLRLMDRSNPQQFRLPDDIRNHFTGIATLLDGSYSSGYDPKPVKFDRAGFPEERDIFKLKNKSKVVLCYVCKESAAPRGSGVAQGLSAGRKILSCDYCTLYWHMDCIDPPLANVPNPQKKWMCPNHAQHVAPKRRTLKHNMEEIKVTRPGMRNNGNIEIVDGDDRPPLDYETMYINGKKYKVPEKVIRLDFWAKIINKSKGDAPSDVPQPTARTVEEIFGGQSPLSTCPSSPEVGSSQRNQGSFADAGPEAHAEAANVLSHLASQGMSRVNGAGQASNQSSASSSRTDSTMAPQPNSQDKVTNATAGQSHSSARNVTPPPRRLNGLSNGSPVPNNGARIMLRLPQQSPGSRTIYNQEPTAQPPVLQPYSNPSSAKPNPPKLDSVIESNPVLPSNGSVSTSISSSTEDHAPMEID